MQVIARTVWRPYPRWHTQTHYGDRVTTAAQPMKDTRAGVCVISYLYPATCRNPNGSRQRPLPFTDFPQIPSLSSTTVIVRLPDLLRPIPPEKKEQKEKNKGKGTFCLARPASYTISDTDSNSSSTSISPPFLHRRGIRGRVFGRRGGLSPPLPSWWRRRSPPSPLIPSTPPCQLVL